MSEAVKNKKTKKERKGDSFGVLQRVGRAFMLPIALLPIAGLLLGVGASLTNASMLEAYGLTGIMGEGTLLYSIFTVLSSVGSVIFDNLPLLFALGVALGMAQAEKGTATLSAAIAFFVMHKTISALLSISGKFEEGVMQEGTIANVVGIESLQMGVFGGIIVGLGVAFLHNRTYKIKLPNVISFFGGTRFVPIISTTVYILVGVLMFFIWPLVQNGIYALGDLVLKSGYAGTLIYGFIERILIPFGLHHVFYLPFWQTGVGGSAIIEGVRIFGAQNIFFAELASSTTTQFSVSATRFMSGKFPFMIFGLPAAALAMYSCAKDTKKKVAGGLLLSAALTAMLTGITEPIEFTFLFVAPVLYVIHSILAGLSYMLMHALNVGVGMTFSGGLIDFFLFGVLQGNEKTNWIMIPLVGIVYFIIYFFLFRFMIRKLDYVTPGREDDLEETKLYTRADYNEKKASEAAGGDQISAMILDGLGGKDNVVSVDCCATRLRVTVKDIEKVSDATLKASGAAGVIKSGSGVQVIYGPRVSVIKSELEEYMGI
ncbi:MAG: PTS glucose transporter subunit IIB [Ruminococcaceae bacterium]|nr:PTS glucose transporter subunit IIB [Oscillospiraceae bacterium]